VAPHSVEIPRTISSKAYSGSRFLDLPSELCTLYMPFFFEHEKSIWFEYFENQEQLLSEDTHSGKEKTPSPVPVKSDAYTII
jgi:hypothetical protein